MDREELEESSSSQNVNFFIQKISERGSAVEIKLSDSSPFFILADDYKEAGFSEGEEISPEKYNQLKKLDEKRSAVKKSVDLLSISSQTEYLLKTKLLKRGFSREASEDAVSYLKNKNLINDTDYAKQWVISRLRKNPSGPYILKGMLSARGVDRETADSVVNSLFTDETAEKAISVQAEKLRRNKKNTDEKIIRKLLSKGFAMKDIRKYFSNNLLILF